MHTRAAASDDIDVIIAAQGGAALGAYSWGVMDELLASPRIKLRAASGTSINALALAFLVEGYTLGGAPQARARLSECWEALIQQQSDTLPFWYKATSDTNDFLHQTAPLIGAAQHALFMMMQQAARFTFGHSVMQLQESPISSFLTMMENKGRGLNFSAFSHPNSVPFIINATHVPHGKSPWDAQAQDERIFFGDQVTQETLRASGTLIGLMPPPIVNGETLYDGAHTANPHTATLVGMAKGALGRQARKDRKRIKLVVIRTRETNAHIVENTVHGSPEWARAKFNQILDKHQTELEQTLRGSNIDLIVIEPHTHQETTGQLHPAEMRFDRTSVERLKHEGQKDARETLATRFGIAPEPHTGCAAERKCEPLHASPLRKSTERSWPWGAHPA